MYNRPEAKNLVNNWECKEQICFDFKMDQNNIVRVNCILNFVI